MSRLDVKERERLANTLVLCSLVGLVMALAVATVMVYEESSSGVLNRQGGRTIQDNPILETPWRA